MSSVHRTLPARFRWCARIVVYHAVVHATSTIWLPLVCSRLLTICLTVCVALVAVAANVWVMVEQSNLTPKDYALRAYAIFFCGTIVLAESEWARFIEQLKVLEQFSAKGIWYGFVGLLTLDMVSRRACARCPT